MRGPKRQTARRATNLNLKPLPTGYGGHSASFRFHPSYGILTLALIGIEIFIGACLHDAVIRPYGGDLLVVILLYCAVRTFWDLPVVPLALGVLAFSYVEETLQYFHLADRLGFTKPSLARTLIGTYFTWVDMLSYTLGIAAVLVLEGLARRQRAKHLQRATI